LHGAVTPAFQQWDKDMSAKLSQVQQQYAPWQQIIDGGASPENVSGALELVQMIQSDPGQAIVELAQWAASQGVDLSGLGGDGGGGGQGDGEQGPSDEGGEELPDWAREIQQSQQQSAQLLDLLAQKTIADGEAAELETAVDQMQEQLEAALGPAGVDPTDETAMDFIFAQLMNGADPKDAVSKWSAFQQAVTGRQASAGAPKVLGAGGGLPTQQVDLSQPLSKTDRKALAVQRARDLMAGGG